MKQRKNILFLTNRVPFPPDKGDKIRTFHQLDRLALSHNVYCACFIDHPRDVVHARALRRWCADVIALRWTRGLGVLRASAGWLRSTPLTIAAYRSGRMRRCLARWGQAIDFDVAVAFSSIMAPYALNVPARRRVLDLCDVDSQKWLDYARDSGRGLSKVYREEGRRLRAYEEACIKRFDATLLITARERALLDPENRSSTLFVVPNGVALLARKPILPSRQGAVISFVGAMNYRPNVRGICWFAQDVWPRVLEAIPDARLRIVGRDPRRSVRRLARVAGIEVCGAVDDVRRVLAESRVVIAPLQDARGLQNKVLEAMAMRRPVVATRAVAASLRVEPGRNILVADHAAEFADQVIDVCRSDALCDDVGEAGRRCVAAHYSWTDALDGYERVLLGPLADTPAERDSAALPRQRSRSVFAQRFRGEVRSFEEQGAGDFVGNRLRSGNAGVPRRL